MMALGECIVPSPGDFILCVHIYPDGSFVPDSSERDSANSVSAWAFTALAEHLGSQFSCLGVCSDSLHNSGDLVSRLENISSTTLELLALCWSLIWIISLGDALPSVNFMVHSDSIVALGVAEFIFVSDAHPELQHVVNQLLSLVRSLRGCTLMQVVGYPRHVSCNAF